MVARVQHLEVIDDDGVALLPAERDRRCVHHLFDGLHRRRRHLVAVREGDRLRSLVASVRPGEKDRLCRVEPGRLAGARVDAYRRQRLRRVTQVAVGGPRPVEAGGGGIPFRLVARRREERRLPTTAERRGHVVIFRSDAGVADALGGEASNELRLLLLYAFVDDVRQYDRGFASFRSRNLQYGTAVVNTLLISNR